MSKEYLKRRQEIRAAARRRRKRVLATVVLVLLIVVFVGAFFIRAVASSEKEYVTYTVGYGDTLWSIARDVYGDRCDIRYKIDDIERDNGIMDATIYPGMVLLVEAE